MKKVIFRILCFSFLAIVWANLTFAQTPSTPPDDEPDFIVPARPTVSNPAEFQRPGVLQLELGYNANFHATGTRVEQDMPLALRFAVSRRILLEFDGDSPLSQTDTSGFRTTGAGDSQIGIQFVLQHEKETRPGVSVAYYVKIPTASSAKGLGTGRVDHNFIGLISKTVKKTTIDFNAIYLLSGRTSEKGHASSGQAALAVTESLTKRFGIQGEISGYSRNDAQSGAMFGFGVVTYQLNKRVVFDSGVRFGLTPDAPRAGVVAGITVGVANLYKSTINYLREFMSNETQPVRIETGEEVAFELMKFIAEKENKSLAEAEIRDYYLDLFVECATAVYNGERK